MWDDTGPTLLPVLIWNTILVGNAALRSAIPNRAKVVFIPHAM